MAQLVKYLLIILSVILSCHGHVDNGKELDVNSTSSLNCSAVSEKLIQEIRSYKPVVNKIIKAVMSGEFKGTTYKDLEYFVDNFGSRLTGSEALEKSIDFMVDKMKAIGLDNVHPENVTAPKWVRGDESTTMLKPYFKKLTVLGLAFGIETPAEGITAEIIVVDGFTDLAKNVKNATGKILVYNQPFEDAEKAIKYRQLGAIEASKLGAVATLVRSYATFSLGTPHTGLLFYSNDTPSIPAGEISIEDAQFLHRLYKKGEKVVVNLKLQNQHLGEIVTRNSIADRIGSTNPKEYVLISGHIDSYDVGQGALDDGYGVVLSVKANEVLNALNLTTRRTIRTILWTAEETGEVPYGAAQYVEAHRDELNNYTMFLEADSGIIDAHGLIFNGTIEAGCLVEEILRLLEPELIKKTKLYPSFPRLKTDIVPLMGAVPVPGALIATDFDKYFWYHHSNADTMSAIDSKDLDVCLAMWSALSYVLADLSFMLPR